MSDEQNKDHDGRAGDTLLAHLALRFVTQRENLATEALGHILRSSATARAATRALLADLNVDVPDTLTYRNQVGAGEDDAQPDLVAYDVHGDPAIVIEAKFWAGLTEHQPVTYVMRLPDSSGTLLFIAPTSRLTILWNELVQRCEKNALHVGERKATVDEARCGSFDSGRTLALVSWRSLLERIASRLQAPDERGVLEDVTQLRGLCERTDAERFLPVLADELTTHIFQRVVEFGAIVDEVTARLNARNIASTKGYRQHKGNGYYGFYMRIGGVGAALLCDVRKWMKYASTPLWLSVFGEHWAQGQTRAREIAGVRAALQSLENAAPPRMFMAKDGSPTVALLVPVGVEQDDVIEAVIAQIEHVAALLKPLVVVGGGSDAGPPAD